MNFFVEADPILARDSVISKLSDIHSKQEILKLLEEEMSKPFEPEGFQWKIQMVEDYSETTSCLIVKFHHQLSDGMGLNTLFSLLNTKASHLSIPKM